MLLNLDCTNPELGCTGLYDDAHDILTCITTALATIDTTDACDALEAYVAHGQPIAPLLEGHDRLSVGLVSAGMVAQEQSAALMASGHGSLQTFEVNWRVELWMQGFPPPLTGEHGPVMPPAADLDRFSAQLLSIGALAYQSVLTARANGTILSACQRSSVSNMTPLGPSAGLAGWGWNVVTRA